jgi:hypothetical protein
MRLSCCAIQAGLLDEQKVSWYAIHFISPSFVICVPNFPELNIVLFPDLAPQPHFTMLHDSSLVRADRHQAQPRQWPYEGRYARRAAVLPHLR